MPELRRALTRLDTTALAVGTMIGTGILLKPALMLQEAGSPALVLLAWAVGGVLTLFAALTYAELGALFPRAGGEYVYLREAYGRGPAFVFGAARYLVSGGSSAAYGVAFATFLSALVPLAPPSRTLVAVGTIAALTAVNCAGVLVGGRLQTLVASAKVLGLLVLVAGLAVAAARGTLSLGALASSAGPVDGARGGLAGFGAAVLASVWAYAGWFMVSMAAGEVKDARRVLPFALTAAALVVVALYLLVNVAFLTALPIDAIATANSTRFPAAPSVANRAATVLLGAPGAAFATLLFLAAVVGSLNGTLLAVPRIPYAMARDGIFPAAFGRVGERSRAPVWSVATLGALGVVLAFTGTFDQLTTTVTFVYCVGFAANSLGLFVLRRKLSGVERPFPVPGYPVVPGLFFVGSILLMGNTVVTNPREAITAIGLFGACGVAYLVFRRRAHISSPEKTPSELDSGSTDHSIHRSAIQTRGVVSDEALGDGAPTPNALPAPTRPAPGPASTS